MEQIDYSKENKIIAEFMNTDIIHNYLDWNCLMDVIDKIESIKIPQISYGFNFSIKGKRCVTISDSLENDIIVIGFCDYKNKKTIFRTRKETTFIAIVEFIKWYKKYKK